MVNLNIDSALLTVCRVWGNSPEILVGPMPVSLRKNRMTPVCSSPSPLGRFARPLHEHDTTVHPPSINIRSQVVSTGKPLASPLNDTISLFEKQSGLAFARMPSIPGLAFARMPSVPDMINSFNNSTNSASQQVLFARVSRPRLPPYTLLAVRLSATSFTPGSPSHSPCRCPRRTKRSARSGACPKTGDRRR